MNMSNCFDGRRSLILNTNWAKCYPSEWMMLFSVVNLYYEQLPCTIILWISLKICGNVFSLAVEMPNRHDFSFWSGESKILAVWLVVRVNISVKVCLHLCVYMYIWDIYDYKTCYIKDLLTSEVFIFPHNSFWLRIWIKLNIICS